MSPTQARRLRIAFVYDALSPYVKGGAEERYHELAKRLAVRHEVHYITWRFWDGAGDVVQEGIRLHGVGTPPSLYGADGKRTVREAMSFAARLLPAMLRGRYDVIDCSATPYLPLYAASLGSWLSRTPLVATWHEFWGEHWHSYLAHRPLVALVARMTESLSRRLGDRILAVSPFTARRMRLGERAAWRVHVVPNGVSLDEIRRARRVRDRIDVVFVGRLIDDKRVDLLLDAVRLLGDRLPSLRCVIVGDGPARASLEFLAARLGIGSRVRFVGRVEEGAVFGYLKAAKVLALPSVREGFAIVVAEAQACGAVPVVVRSRLSAAPDLVRDGVDGLVCHPDAESLADAIARLLADPAALAAMGRRAQRAARHLDWDALAAQVEDIYLQLARPLPARRARRWCLS